jgi:hypothetical protein
MAEPPPGARPLDRAELVERLRSRPSTAGGGGRLIAHAGTVLTGRLVRHGEANYEFRDEAAKSYYVELLTSAGPRLQWGVDLKRALAQSDSQPKIGDLVGVQRVGYQLVDAPSGRDGAQLRRVRWRIDRVERLAAMGREARQAREVLLEERQQMRRRPELRAAYVSLAIAREFAERRIRDPQDRERFIERLQEVMRASVVAAASRPLRSEKGTRRVDHEPPAR